MLVRIILVEILLVNKVVVVFVFLGIKFWNYSILIFVIMLINIVLKSCSVINVRWLWNKINLV